MNANTVAVSSGRKTQNRLSDIRRAIADIFEDLSGKEISTTDSSTTFLEMGFDSLFLTQVAQALQTKLGLKIMFRQLLSDQATLDDLAAYIDSELPEDAFLVEAATSATVGAIVPQLSSHVSNAAAVPMLGDMNREVGASESAVERLMRDQLQAMNQLFAQQLAALQGQSSADSATVNSRSALSAAIRGSGVPRSVASPTDKGSKELKGYTPFKPLPRNASGELTSRQKEHIEALIELYTKRTAGSKQKTQEYRSVLADPRVVAGFRTEWKEMIYPIVAVRSKGSKLWDVDGNEYVDILNGFGPIMLGHRPDFVQEAIAKQLQEGFEIGPQTLLAGEVAKMILRIHRKRACNFLQHRF